MPSWQDVSAKKSLEFPELYVIGQQDELFNYRVFSITVLHGLSTSLASFYIALWAFEDRVGSRAVGDYESFAVTVATSALLSVLMEVSARVPFPMLAPGQMFRAQIQPWAFQHDPQQLRGWEMISLGAGGELGTVRKRVPAAAVGSALADHPGHQVLDIVVLSDGHNKPAALLPLLLPDPKHRCLQDSPCHLQLPR